MCNKYQLSCFCFLAHMCMSMTIYSRWVSIIRVQNDIFLKYNKPFSDFLRTVKLTPDIYNQNYTWQMRRGRLEYTWGLLVTNKKEPLNECLLIIIIINNIFTETWSYHSIRINYYFIGCNWYWFNVTLHNLLFCNSHARDRQYYIYIYLFMIKQYKYSFLSDI